MWETLQDRICKNHIEDVEELRQRVEEGAWNGLGQRVIDYWDCNRVMARDYIAADGEHLTNMQFEHYTHLPKCSWLAFKEEMMESFVA